MPPRRNITRCLLVLFTALVLTWSGPVWAMSKEMGAAYKQYSELNALGKYADAIPYAKRFIELAGQELGETHQHYAVGLVLLATLYRDQGRYNEAEPLYKRALVILEKTLGPEHQKVAKSLGNLAMLYYLQGRHDGAELLHKRALAIFEKTLGPEHQNVSNLLGNLATLYRDQGRYAAAEPLFKRALAINEKALGPEHPSVAYSLNNLAGLYYDQGRYAEAEPLYKHALTIREKALGPGDVEVGQSLAGLAELYVAQGRYVEAEPLYKRSLAIYEKARGLEHPYFATVLVGLAGLYLAQGRYAEAEPLYKRSLSIYEKERGTEHLHLANVLGSLAVLYGALGRYAEAEPLHKRALAIWEKALGPGHPRVARVIDNLGSLFRDLGRYAEAEPLIKRALAIYEKTLGPDHPDVANTLHNLALLYKAQGRYAEAEPLSKRALAIAEKAFGSEHPDLARALVNLAARYKDLGRYAEAEPLFLRSLEILKKALGPEHPDVANTLEHLALLYQNQGRYVEVEPLHKRSLAIREKALGPEHPDVAASLNNLAQLYQDQGRYAEAESLIKRALAKDEKALGPEHPFVAASLNNLAKLYHGQGRYATAEPLLKRALAIKEKALGPRHPDRIPTLVNLAQLYIDQGRYAEAEPLYKRAVAIWEKALGLENPHTALLFGHIGYVFDVLGLADADMFYKNSLSAYEKTLGPEHPDVANTLNDLAGLYTKHGRFAEAEPLLKRALAISEKVLGPEHRSVAITLNNLALNNRGQGRYLNALNWQQRCTTILRHRFTAQSVQESQGLLSEQRGAKPGFFTHIDLALHPEQVGGRGDLVGEAFEVLQLARTSAAGGAIARMAARFAAGSDRVATMVRLQQDVLRQYQTLDQKLIKELSASPEKRNNELEKNFRKQIASLKAKLTSLDKEIATQFPKYATLMSREPMPGAEVQKLLGKEEALLTFIRSWEGDKTHVFVMRPDSLRAYTVPVSLEEIKDAVTELRAGLDLSDVQNLSDLSSFDTTLAFELYEKLFKPAEKALQGVKHLFVVPTGPLQSLPLGVLVTSKPKKPSNFADYRDIPWLAKKYAITTLPSVSSLKALRVFAARTEANKPFIGFGDPVLDGPSGGGKGIKIASLFRGAIADVEEVRKLSRLPETADELRAMAHFLGADASSIYLGKDATETKVKEINLKSARVIAFSTHGLISGDIKHLAEPALVLTPPDKATEADDGLLTASEIAQLKLNAEWVILSACNTAHAESAGAEGLSGLAKAFFYAGSRALLVSHWPVESQSATELTRGMFEALKTNPSMGRSEALRRSMFKLAANDNHPHWAHPAFWAPFVVVGEGARR